MKYKAKKNHAQNGVTLIELMISLLLGLILIGGLLSSFIANKNSFRVSENLARIQENSRIGFELMSRSIREAGDNPCGAKLVANVIRSGGAIPWWADWNAGTIVGFDGTEDTTQIAGFGTAEGNRVSGTDAILILQTGGAETNVTAHTTASSELTVVSATSFQANDIALACDPQTAAIFQIGSVNSGTNTINYDSGTATMNCGNGLGYPTTLACATTSIKLFSTTNGQITKIDPVFWYIGFNAQGKRSLYKTQISKTTIAGVVTITTNRDEVLSNIKDLQIKYLVKDLGTSTLASNWIDASDTILSAANGGWSESNANQVVAARLTLTIQSEEAISTSNTQIERQLIQVIGLRNRDTLFQATP